MNISESACQVITSNSILASASDGGNSQVSRVTQFAAQTTLQHSTSLFAEQSTQFSNYASQISPLNILTSSAQAFKGAAKWMLVAALISSKVVIPVAAELKISAPASYTVIPGANVTLNNPPIFVSGNVSDNFGCTLSLPLPLQGMLYVPGTGVYQSRNWILTTSKDSVNSAYQNVVFNGNLMNISTTLNVSCSAVELGTSKIIRATTNILLFGTYPPAITPMPTTIGATTQTSGLTQTNAPVTSLTTGLTTQSQLIPSTASSALQTQSVASNLFSSMSTITSEQSQNMATGTLVTTASFLANVSQIETQLDPAQMTSTPNDFNRYGWIVLAIAGVLLCAGGLTVVCILVRKKSNEKAVEDGVPGNLVQKPVDNSQYSKVPPPAYDIVPTLDVQNNYAGMPAGQQPNHYHAPASRSNNVNQAGSKIYEQPDAPMN